MIKQQIHFITSNPKHYQSEKRVQLINIKNGNGTEWSIIQSVIIGVINKTGQPWSQSLITDRATRLVTGVWLQTEPDNLMSCYQLHVIIIITIGDLIFMRMNEQVTYIIDQVLYQRPFLPQRQKSTWNWPIHPWAGTGSLWLNAGKIIKNMENSLKMAVKFP